MKIEKNKDEKEKEIWKKKEGKHKLDEASVSSPNQCFLMSS